jgi:hypothetical protein
LGENSNVFLGVLGFAPCLADSGLDLVRIAGGAVACRPESVRVFIHQRGFEGLRETADVANSLCGWSVLGFWGCSQKLI